MSFGNLVFGRRIGWSIWVSLMLAVTLGLAASSFAGKGNGGGGGKPPKDDPPPSSPSNPVIVLIVGPNLVLVDDDGGNQVVVHTLAESTKASWCSPNGTDIIFRDVIDGTRGIYLLEVVQVDGDGNRTPLVGQTPDLVATTNDTGISSPYCSPVPVGPDNRIKVVFSDRGIEPDGSLSQNEDFYLVNLDSSGPVLLLDGLTHGLDHNFIDGINQYSPSWSPQGDRIVFVSRPWDGFGLPIDVEIIDVTWDESGNLIPDCCDSLIQGVDGSPLQLSESILRPRWSNDGDKISVDSREGNTRAIWILPLSQPANAARVNYDQIEDVIRTQVAWSPDDSQLVYMRNPRRGMCGEGDGRKVKGLALAVSNVGGASEPIGNCDEVAIARGGRLPDWWRGPSCGNGILQEYVGEQCDDGNNDDGDSCSAICMLEPVSP